jgi:hypothetical protein
LLCDPHRLVLRLGELSGDMEDWLIAFNLFSTKIQL